MSLAGATMLELIEKQTNVDGKVDEKVDTRVYEIRAQWVRLLLDRMSSYLSALSEWMTPGVKCYNECR